MLGGRVYLQAGALGLGCCGIGAFFDDDVSEVIGVDSAEELVIYMAAMGVKGG
jgi:nitroreductase